MAHGYLNALGVASDEACVFNTLLVDDSPERAERFARERAEHGFDSRETWSMGYTLATWLYEHLAWYRDNAPVDMSFHTFDVPAWDDRERRVREGAPVTMTQAECLDAMLEDLGFAIRHDAATGETAAEAHERMRHALIVLAECADAMWW